MRRKKLPRPVEAYVLRLTIGITGGRDRRPTKDQRRAVGFMRFPKGTHLVHGGAQGIDVSVAKRAKLAGWITTCVSADWGGYPNIAGHIRNALIVRASDILITFGGNTGTRNCVAQATFHRRPIVDLSGLKARDGEDISVPLPNGRIRRQWGERGKREGNGNFVLPPEVADNSSSSGGASREGSSDGVHEGEEFGDASS